MSQIVQLPPGPLPKTRIVTSVGRLAGPQWPSEKAALSNIIRDLRLVDNFTDVSCIAAHASGLIEDDEMKKMCCDEIYLGINKLGVGRCFNLHIGSGRGRFDLSRIRRSEKRTGARFSDYTTSSIAAQLTKENVIVLQQVFFERGQLRLNYERHFELISPSELCELVERRETSYLPRFLRNAV